MSTMFDQSNAQPPYVGSTWMQDPPLDCWNWSQPSVGNRVCR